MLDKSRVDKELARRLCAAFVSHQMGVTIATQYKKTPEDVGDLWTPFVWPVSDSPTNRGSQETLRPLSARIRIDYSWTAARTEPS